MRWMHPDRGFVPPDLFVPVAERGGFIRELSDFVCEQALRDARSWYQAGLDLSVSVNLSARDLLDPTLPGRFNEFLVRNELPGSLLRVEITETTALTDVETSLRVLRRLAEMGVGISVDDYGTGYSSLSYLTDLPIDEIKVDQRFVKHIDEDQRDETIVRSTVRLGHDLGLTVVAEGVESAGGLERLTSMGCDAVQGYAIARPLTEQALRAWLDDPAHAYRPRRRATAVGGGLDTLLETTITDEDER